MVIGDSRTYNRGDHYGRLRVSAAEGDALRLTVRMPVAPAPRIENGTLTLGRKKVSFDGEKVVIQQIMEQQEDTP